MCTMDTMDNESMQWIVAKEEAIIRKSFGQNIVTRPVITPRKTYFPGIWRHLKFRMISKTLKITNLLGI